MRADTLIRDCLILPMTDKPLIQNGLIAIKDSRMVFVGRKASAPQIDAEREIEAKNMVAIPGLVNCHTHLPMTLFRGIAEDRPLDEWLREAIWPLERRLKSSDVHDGALLGCLEMIKGGTTCFADMYFHEDMVAQAAEESGLRAVLAEGIIGLAKGLLGRVLVNRGVKFARRFNRRANGRISVMLGPHSVYSCNENLLEDT